MDYWLLEKPFSWNNFGYVDEVNHSGEKTFACKICDKPRIEPMQHDVTFREINPMPSL